MFQLSHILNHYQKISLKIMADMQVFPEPSPNILPIQEQEEEE